MLIGQPTIATLTTPGLIANWRDTSFGVYAQDDWKVTPRLTVNLGLRYDSLHAAHGQVRSPGDPGFRGKQHDQAGRDQRHLAGGLRLGPQQLRAAAGIRIAAVRRHALRHPRRLRAFLRQGKLEHTPGSEQPAAVSHVASVSRPGSISQVFTGSGTIPLPNVNAFQTDFRDADHHQWNVFVEGEPISDFTVGIGYVGSKGESLPLTRDINQPTPGTGAVQARRPIPQYATISYVTSDTSSIYHSLQARAERRFRRGLGFLMSYTLSKAIDTVPIYGGSAPDATNVDAARGPADTDSRHRFSAKLQLRAAIRTRPRLPGKCQRSSCRARRRLAGERHRLAGVGRSVHAVCLSGCRSARDVPAASGLIGPAAGKSTIPHPTTGSMRAASRPRRRARSATVDATRCRPGPRHRRRVRVQAVHHSRRPPAAVPHRDLQRVQPRQLRSAQRHD